MTNPRSARQLAIMHLLRSRGWISATSLAERFNVSQRTIYRDIEQMISQGIPIEATAGRNGGFRLARENPVDPLIVDSDDALQLYIMGLIQQESLESSEQTSRRVSSRTRQTISRLSQRIFFDTTDWYWRDDGSGHLRVLRDATMTSTAVDLSFRQRGPTPRSNSVVKPYGLVWKAGDWWLVAARLRGDIERIKLSNIDRVEMTDLRFDRPESFVLAEWWRQALENFGRGSTKVVLAVQSDSREEMLRLNLKPDSQVRDGADGLLYISLFVDQWRWLVPLLATYGDRVRVIEPPELVLAVRSHHEAAVRMYDSTNSKSARDTELYRNDDSRLRATRGRNPGEVNDLP